METKDIIEGITSTPSLDGGRIYLDYNATTPVLPEIWDQAVPYLTEYFGNPSSGHWAGAAPRKALAKARAQVAQLIHAQPHQIIFTSGGTEANYLGLWGTLRMQSQGLIATSDIEHPAVKDPLHRLIKNGWQHHNLSVNSTGTVSKAELLKCGALNVDAVSLMLANNETGVIQPVGHLRTLLGDKIFLHTDAAQAVGKIPVDVSVLDVDALTMAGHKLYAPKGIGALYLKNPKQLMPLFKGGGQESGLRAGTENIPYIVALGAAAELATQTLQHEQVRLRALRDQLYSLLKNQFPTIQWNGMGADVLPNTLSVRFPGCNGQNILKACPTLAASTGSACHDGTNQASAVLLSMGIPNEEALGTVRLSIGRGTTKQHITVAARTLARAAHATFGVGL